MEMLQMASSISDGCLTVEWFVFESDEWGGEDFVKRFEFDQQNTSKLMSSFGKELSEEKISEFLDAKFGHDLYNCGLDKYCQTRDIHYLWHEFVDYPGIYSKSGRC